MYQFPVIHYQPNFLTYRNLKELNLLLGDDDNIIVT